jgi:ATP adenylyltransferase
MAVKKKKRTTKNTSPKHAPRRVLFRPDRYKYVKKIERDEGCVFCRAAEGPPSFETLCVFKTKHSMVVLNKYPYNSGHILILPQAHIGNLQDLSSDQYSDLMDLVQRCFKAVEKSYQPGGLNFGLNQGATAGAGLPDHLHFHLIPRWSGDLNFFPLIADTKVVIESLEQTYEKVKAALVSVA